MEISEHESGNSGFNLSHRGDCSTLNVKLPFTITRSIIFTFGDNLGSGISSDSKE
uniref:Uncharacterized protein n=1 Tax=Rhizophagus irregularis (strain DAOM 181602 / DAOM 197198 / MUCL 43194) TaxID=747089 RepID=U9U7U1_RHIID